MKNSKLDEFCRNFNVNPEEVIKFKEIDGEYLLVTVEDGYYLYDCILKSTQYNRKMSALIEKHGLNNETWLMLFGKEIYRMRINLYMNQKDMCDKLELAAGSMSSYSNGMSAPNIYILLSLMEMANATYKDFLRVMSLSSGLKRNSMVEINKDRRTWSLIFIDKLCRLMERKGLNKSDLAYIMQVTPATVSSYFTGKTVPKSYAIYRLIDMLDLSDIEIKELLQI